MIINRDAAEREYRLGLQAYAKGNLKEAERHFEAALRYDPTHRKARIALDKLREQMRK